MARSAMTCTNSPLEKARSAQRLGATPAQPISSHFTLNSEPLCPPQFRTLRITLRRRSTCFTFLLHLADNSNPAPQYKARDSSTNLNTVSGRRSIHMKGKLLFVVLFLFALLAGSAYGAGPQPVVTFTFVCNNGPFQGSGPCPKGGRPGPLIQGSDGNFYGTSQVSSEGNSQPNGGTVFSLTPTGMFKLLHTFVATPNNYANGNNPGFLIEG